MTIDFRYAKHEDLAKIVETYNSTIPSRVVTADTEEISVQSRQEWFDSHSQDKRPLWIVSCNEEYAGWMSFNSFYGRPAYQGAIEISIYLEDKFRGKGLGKICLQMAIDVAPELNIHSLLGFIFGHNDTSLKLFYSFGFEKWAHLPGIANLDGTMRDLLILGKKV
ncbi:GNAT family N-acetyltransferase [Aurantibacillus circumpalustris]|uniref:GNAT family N-acetyltransferase n=1 Tax=Aurantibacillus circumpalustris TaxID=3036359 RepID=UPI00295BF359|nr:GNAT family N-acetyltransferase [Aurantibacillus circumpalustris]